MGYSASKPSLPEPSPSGQTQSDSDPTPRPVGKPFNPFYVALILVGIVFAVTATAYGVMTVQKLNQDRMDDIAVDQGLNGFLDKHGFQTMMIELGCLAVVTVSAMVLDEVRDRRKVRRSQ